MKNSVKLELVYDYNQISEEELEELRSYGIETCDWDFMLFCSPEYLDSTWEEEYNYETKQKEKKEVFIPNTYAIERLAFTSQDCKWYKINFQGNLVAVGIGYH